MRESLALRRPAAARIPRRDFQAPSTERTLDILELLARHPRGLTLNELAEGIGAPAGSVYRLAMILQQRGYLHRDPETKHFSLTSALLRLGYAALSEQNLVEIALDAMHRLRDDVKETVLIGTLRHAEGVILAQLPGLHQFKFTIDPGMFMCLHTAAPAKAILASLPSAELASVLKDMEFKKLTPHTITGREAFEAELETVRQKGYAVDHAEEFESVHCVGAAVKDLHGYPAAAIWVTGPAERMPKERFEWLGRQVKNCADSISNRLGAGPLL